MSSSATDPLPTPQKQTGPSVALRIISSPHSGEEFILDSHQTLVIGRVSDAQWRMAKDAFFSRYHFRIEANPPDCWLVVLGSTNGTQVNGHRVQNVDLKIGDRIECGETVFEVAITPSPDDGDNPSREISSRGSISKTIDLAARFHIPSDWETSSLIVSWAGDQWGSFITPCTNPAGERRP